MFGAAGKRERPGGSRVNKGSLDNFHAWIHMIEPANCQNAIDTDNNTMAREEQKVLTSVTEDR
jgi:hypothetical protein